MTIELGKQSDTSGEVLRTIDIDAGRRAFVRSLGFGAAGATVLAAGAGVPTDAQAQGISDADILNFALNLEYLEAEFYLRASLGRGLFDVDTTGSGARGNVTGGRQIAFSDPIIRNYALEIADDEEKHVKFLRAALGGAQVARPQIDLATSFTAAARAASVIGPNQTFDAFANDTSFLLAAFIFEDVGVTAYKGAAPLITRKDYLAAAAGILAVEAYHAGEIRTILYSRGIFKETFLISELRDFADGPADLDQGIGDATVANIIPTDANSLAFDRTPAQVINIVTLGNGSAGGFFPVGLNGTIR